MSGTRFGLRQAPADTAVDDGTIPDGAGLVKGADVLAWSHGPRDARRVALTFDDGPVERTEEIVGILDDFDAVGTFFLVGRSIPGHEALLRRMARSGHELGNHSFQHPMHPRQREIEATSELIHSITGWRPRSFRPPFGGMTGPTAAAADRLGMRVVLWDANSGDTLPEWKGISAAAIHSNLAARVDSGSIVLLHDGCPWSKVAEALPAVCSTLSERGYSFVSVDELLSGSAADAAPRKRLRRRLRRLAAARRHPLPAWARPSAPVSQQELDGMGPRDVITFLERFESDGKVDDPAREALAEVLVERFSHNPFAFTAQAPRLVALGPAYVTAALAAVNQVTKKRRRLDWPGVLTLAEAANEARAAGLARGDASLARHGGRGCEQVLEILAHCLPRQLVPPGHEERIWQIVDELSWSSSGPSVADGEEAERDALRARAAGLVVEYALWRAGEAGGGLDALPAVRGNLEAHLEPATEASVAVRGALGGRLGQLHTLDPRWAAEHVGRLFPADDEALREAAWEGYVSWNRATSELFDLIRGEYRWAVERLPTPAQQRRGDDNDPGRALARHLVWLYLGGVVELEPNGLLHRFCTRAAADELGHLLRLCGTAPERADMAIGPTGPPRLADLWDAVVDWTADRPASERDQALGNFGAWYASGGFEPGWADAHLEALLRAGIAVEPQFRVWLGVAERAPGDPATAARLARLFVGNERDPWRLYSVRESLRRIATAAEQSADGAAAESAALVRDALRAPAVRALAAEGGR